MKVEINIPDGLSDITLAQYQRFARISGDEEFLAHKKLEIFAGIDLKMVKAMKASDVARIANKINEVLSEKPEFQPTFTLEGVEYGFHPNLDDITFGELHDIEENISDYQKMHMVMAVLYRPILQKIKDRYRITDYTGTHLTEDAMKSAPMSVVQGMMVFFWRLGIDLSATLIQSLEGTIAQTIPQHPNSPGSGDGTISSMPLPEVISSNLMQLRDSTPSLL